MSRAELSLSEMRQDVQGLRGVSVVLVILYHAELNFFEGGFIGVDIFFVISGYVIFRSILQEIDRSGIFDVGQFVSRRIKRIIPASTVVLTLVTSFSVVFLDPFSETIKTIKFGGAATFFGSNIYGAIEDPYFKSKFNPFLHYWSLGVEEQFYVGVALTFVVFKYFKILNNRRALRNWLLMIGTTSLLFSVVLTNFQGPLSLIGKSGLSEEQINSIAFYFPITRFWQICAGASIAFIPFIKMDNSTIGKRLYLLSSYCGVLLIVASLFVLGPGAEYPGIYSIPPTAAAACLIFGGHKSGNWISGVLSIRPMKFLGDISFGLYLLHFPIFVFVQRNFDWNLYSFAGCLVLTFATAIALYKYVEQPFRMNKRIVGKSALKFLCAALAVQVLALSASFVGNHYVRQHFSVYERSFTEKQGITPLYGGCNGEIFGANGEWCRFQIDRAHSTIVLVGDSHARSISDAVFEVAERTEANLVVMSEPGCVFNFTNSDERCLRINNDRINWIQMNRPQTVVVMNSLIGTDGKDSWSEGIIDLSSKLSIPNLNIVVVSPIPQMDFSKSISYVKGIPDFKKVPLRDQINIVQKPIELIHSLEKNGNVRVIESWKSLCPQNLCSPIRDEVFIYQDFVHLNSIGSKLLVPQLMDAIDK